jgi:hypothetical protein
MECSLSRRNETLLRLFIAALRATIIEGKGDCSPSKLAEFQHIMRSLWEELSDLADFDKVRSER